MLRKRTTTSLDGSTKSSETDALMLIASQTIEPHGYKLPKHSMIVLEIAYVSGEDTGMIENKIILPQDVILVGFQIRCDPEV